MKMRPIVSLSALALLAMTARGQGTFQNLDFEAARVPPHSAGVDVTNALPGWTAFSGTTQLSTIYYNPASVPFANVNLMGGGGVQHIRDHRQLQRHLGFGG